MRIIVATPACPICHRDGEMPVEVDGYRNWMAGTLIQRALPDLTADEREQLMTGTHPDCWDAMWNEEE